MTRKKSANIKYTIKTDSRSIGGTVICLMLTFMAFGLTAAYFLVPAFNSMPDNPQNIQYAFNATGKYAITYVPTTDQILNGLVKVVAVTMATVGSTLAVYMFTRPSKTKWLIKRSA